MKKSIILVELVLISFSLYSQKANDAISKGLLKITAQSENKVLSGRLYEQMINTGKLSDNKLKNTADNTCNIILYFDHYPSAEQIAELEKLGAVLYFQTWTPPMEDHKFGFLIAKVPVSNLPNFIELPFVKKVDTAERTSSAMNNNASMSSNVQMAWAKGYTGKGVKICILDSGIDTTYKGSDFPASFEYKDYSYFPQLDDNVANEVTGHGTHVAATALGRGKLSEGHMHFNNGNGSFKGMAPDADLVFLKIGQDEDAISEDPPTIAAIDAAVNIYHADIISMSYGGWEDYHDGSCALEQKVDWAYSQGVPFFLSGGNKAGDNKHWMGTIAANAESDFIELVVSEPNGDTTMLRFNLVWADGEKRNALNLHYFDNQKQPLNNVIAFPTTESIKGTESQISYYENALYSAGTYYVKVVNNSDFPQVVHIYEDWDNLRIGTNHVSFAEGEPFYTIGAPSSAVHAFSVGAYVSRTGWTSSLNSDRWWGPSHRINCIAPFSSLGPTMDERTKPDITGPGSTVLSLRDKDIYTTEGHAWIDNDGITGGEANYYAMRGTSMACPVVAGAAALFLEKYPDASPQQVYDAIKNYSNTTGLSSGPDNTWGFGKLDIFSAIRRSRDLISIDGDLNNTEYETLATFTSGQNSFGDKNTLGELKFHSDGLFLYIGITGELSPDNDVLLFLDFSGVQGRGNNYLGGGDPENYINAAFSYLNNVKMDFDVDFAIDFREGNSDPNDFFIDAIRYGTSNKNSNAGKTNQVGAEINYDIGPLFGGTGFLSVAYDSSYSVNSNKGIEIKIPISAFTGVDTSQTLRLFAVISSRYGNISNECIPGDPGANSLGDGADFSVISNQDFFTQPVKISVPQPTTFIISNEAPGYLIDNLIAQGHGDKNLYKVMQLLQPLSDGAIPQWFMDALASCPAGSEIFTDELSNFAGLNNPVAVNSDGTLMISSIYGRDYNEITGFNTTRGNMIGNVTSQFTSALDAEYYINTGMVVNNGTGHYIAFAIAWTDTVSTVLIDIQDMPDPVFMLYPNPASDKISIRLNKAVSDVRISLFDICGRLLMKVNGYNGSPIDISSLARGIYTIDIESKGFHCIEKFVKQ